MPRPRPRAAGRAASVAPDDTRLRRRSAGSRACLTESPAWAILAAGRNAWRWFEHPRTRSRASRTPRPLRLHPPSSDRHTTKRSACDSRTRPGKVPSAPCSTAQPSADPADPSRSPPVRQTAAACGAGRWPTTASTAARTAARPTSSWILAPGSPAARSAASAARSPPSTDSRRNRSAHRGDPSPPGRTWTAVVDASWISGRPTGKLVDRSLAPAGTAGRSSGQPEGAEEFGSLDRRKAAGPIARWVGLSARGAAPPAREAGDPPADSPSATMVGTPSARTDGEPQGAPELPQGGRAPQGVAMDGRSDGPFGLLRARRRARARPVELPMPARAPSRLRGARGTVPAPASRR